jgi:hypothetical protein
MSNLFITKDKFSNINFLSINKQVKITSKSVIADEAELVDNSSEFFTISSTNAMFSDKKVINENA